MIGDFRKGGGAKEARLSALEAAQRRSKRRVDIEAGIANLSDDVIRQRMCQYRHASSGRVRVGQADHPGRGRKAESEDDVGAAGSQPNG